MTDEIKTIGNVRRPSRYNPDLAQKIIEEDRLEEERRRLEEEKKSGKNPKPTENKAAAEIPNVPDLPVSYNGIEFEARAYRENGSTEKKPFYFNDSLDRIKKEHYERHAKPQEVYGLIIDGLEGKLANTPLQDVYDDFFKSWGEFMSLAWERKGKILIAYLDPEGLVWDGIMYVKKDFKFTEQKEFDIMGKISLQFIDLEEFNDEFVQWHYTRKFSELPEEMREGSSRAQVYLPPEGSIWSLGRGIFNHLNYDVSSFSVWASRGVRKKIP